MACCSQDGSVQTPSESAWLLGRAYGGDTIISRPLFEYTPHSKLPCVMPAKGQTMSSVPDNAVDTPAKQHGKQLTHSVLQKQSGSRACVNNQRML